MGGGGGDALDVHAEGVEIAGGRDGRPLHHGLFVALVVDVVGEVERERPLRDGRGLVGGVIRNVAADAGGAAVTLNPSVELSAG